jgi:glycerate kinase
MTSRSLGPLAVLCAPDSFKGSLSALQASEAMARGIESMPGLERAEVRRLPLADGGEGTVEAIVTAAGGVFRTTEVVGPLGERRTARWGLVDEGKTAVIEMAEAAGLPLVPPPQRNPLHTTTYGVGQLLAAALEEPSVQRMVIGVGGSATCDGGIGAAQALGVCLLDTSGISIPVPATGGDLLRLESIEISGLHPRLHDFEIRVASDVENPLLGPSGAAAVYAPQKGASPDEVSLLEKGLAKLVASWASLGKTRVADLPGAGASGGLAAGLVAFCGARIVPGIDLILDTVRFDRAAASASLVLTGEGAFNLQSLSGKVVSGVARRCRAAGLPLVVLAGSIADAPPLVSLHEWGIAGVFSILDGPRSEESAMENAADLLARRAGWIARLFAAGYDVSRSG